MSGQYCRRWLKAFSSLGLDEVYSDELLPADKVEKVEALLQAKPEREKLTCLILVAFGVANMWLAVFADVGVMILAILNAIRALRVQNL